MSNKIEYSDDQARPAPGKAAQGVYISAETAPFLEMCGQLLHHRGVPVVPVLHIKHGLYAHR